MRLPHRHFFRAFPELDSFSDQQCTRFVSLAQRRHPWRVAGAAVLALAAVIGTVIAAALPAAIILNSRDYSLMRFLSRIPMEVYAILWGGVFVAAAVAGFMVRDVAMRGLVRRHISAMNCIDCGYSLMGLGPYKDPRGIDVVKCPECGVENDLRSRGATVEEFAVLAAGGGTPRGPDAPGAGRG